MSSETASVRSISEDANQEEITDFDQMQLKENVLHGIYSCNIRTPNYIQSISINPIITGHSVIVQAIKGSGKIVALTIGILNQVSSTQLSTQAIVLASTMVSAKAVHNSFVNFGSKIANLKVALFLDENSISDDQSRAQESPHIVVSTPERAHDLLSSGYLHSDTIKIVCVYEDEKVIDNSTYLQFQRIFDRFNEGIQYLLFSSALSNGINSLMENYMTDPIRISYNLPPISYQNIKQFNYNVEKAEDKFSALLDIFSSVNINKLIILTRNIVTLLFLRDELEMNHFVVSVISDYMSDEVINQNIDQFDSGKARYLITTGKYLRSYHFHGVSHIINFEVPDSSEEYLSHLSRASESVAVITICEQEELSKLIQIKNDLGLKILLFETDEELGQQNNNNSN